MATNTATETASLATFGSVGQAATTSTTTTVNATYAAAETISQATS